MQYLPKSRRSFLKKVSVGSLAAFSLTSIGATYAPSVAKTQAIPQGTIFLFQGDSITDGNRGRTPDPNHIMGHGYAFSIASRLGYALPEKELVFYNRGISGNTVRDLGNRWQEDTLNLHPDLLTILVGINDTHSMFNGTTPGKQVTPDAFKTEYRELLSKTRAQNPKTVLVIMQPFIYRNVSTQQNWEQRLADLKARQQITEQLAMDFDAIYVKLQNAFDDACKRAPESFWVWDGIHPTVSGHEIITREWLKQTGKRFKMPASLSL